MRADQIAAFHNALNTHTWEDFSKEAVSAAGLRPFQGVLGKMRGGGGFKPAVAPIKSVSHTAATVAPAVPPVAPKMPVSGVVPKGGAPTIGPAGSPTIGPTPTTPKPAAGHMGMVMDIAKQHNPTMHAASNAVSAFGALPDASKQLIQNSPAVSKWGVQPHAAYQLLHAGRTGTETIEQAIARQLGQQKVAMVLALRAFRAELTKMAMTTDCFPRGSVDQVSEADKKKADAVVMDVLLKYPDLGKKKDAPKQKIAASPTRMLGKSLSAGKGALKSFGEHLTNHADTYDLAGLGVLAAPSLHGLHHQMQNKRQGKSVDKGEVFKDTAETAGLGILAAPVLAGKLLGKKH